MKTLFTTVILSLAVFSCFAQKIQSDLEEKRLKGNVDSVIEKKFTYTQNGKLTQSHLVSKIISKYNIYGNLVSQTYYFSLPNPVSDIEPVILNKELDSSINIFRYDDKQRLVEGLTYLDNVTKPYNKTTYTYSALKKERKSTEISEDGWVNKDFISIKYDDDGRSIETTIFVKTDEPLRTFKYYYDNNGNLIETDEFGKDESSGKMVQMTITKSLYDKFGNKLSSKVFHDTGEVETFVYTYKKHDVMGNWTIMEDSKNKGHSGDKTLRRIVYRTK